MQVQVLQGERRVEHPPAQNRRHHRRRSLRCGISETARRHCAAGKPGPPGRRVSPSGSASCNPSGKPSAGRSPAPWSAAELHSGSVQVRGRPRVRAARRRRTAAATDGAHCGPASRGQRGGIALQASQCRLAAGFHPRAVLHVIVATSGAQRVFLRLARFLSRGQVGGYAEQTQGHRDQQRGAAAPAGLGCLH